jgi:transposase InsO family protein
VREHLRALKSRDRLREQRRLESRRTSLLVQTRDVVWSLDATQLGWDGEHAMWGEVVKDNCTTKVLSVTVGSASTGADIVLLLERLHAERGALPLVLVTDNGAAYRAAEVARWCAEHGVVQLFNEPRTPQHNAPAERGIFELKETSGLTGSLALRPLLGARWSLIESLQVLTPGVCSPAESLNAEHCDAMPDPCQRLARALHVLNEVRARPSRGYWTAAALDELLPPGEHLTSRETFLRTVDQNVEACLRGAHSKRAQRRARREAILRSLEQHGLLIRTRGNAPWTATKPESQV